MTNCCHQPKRAVHLKRILCAGFFVCKLKKLSNAKKEDADEVVEEDGLVTAIDSEGNQDPLQGKSGGRKRKIVEGAVPGLFAIGHWPYVLGAQHCTLGILQSA